MVNIIDEV